MTLEDFRELLGRRPFNPFAVHLTDGRHFEIPSPDYVAVHQGNRMAFVWHATGPGYSFIVLDKITHISHSDAALEASN